ncbi:MAG: hypothetical protein K2X87_12370 [Gemmataceae bacterium]|nr:hypothetical protein [Gemmataceae bacterium]
MSRFGMSVLAAVGLIGCAGPVPEPPAGREVAGAGDQPQPPAAGGTEVPVVYDQPPPAAVPKDTPQALIPIFAERNKLHRREAGARLTITAKWVHNPGVEQAIRVDWAIDYDGPRRPFTIPTPGKGTDPAVAHFWYLQPDGTAAAYTRGVGGDRYRDCRPASSGTGSRWPTAGGRSPAGWRRA